LQSLTDSAGLFADHHDTAQVTIAAAGQAVAIRRETPFGQTRGTTGAWPSMLDKGFVGGTVDKTGLIHLGAREYDPSLGRFASRDPVLLYGQPQQLHGYAYGNNSPATVSDADGLCWPKWACKAAKRTAKRVWHGARKLWHETKKSFKKIKREIRKAASRVWRGIKKGATKLWRATRKATNDIKRNLSRAWRHTVDLSRRITRATTNGLRAAGRETLNAGRNFLRDGWHLLRATYNAPLTLGVGAAATLGGGDCGVNGQEMMLVCSNAPDWMYDRGGTTIGNVFLTGDGKPSERLLAHEAKHADQWAMSQMLLGPVGMIAFPIAYGAEEKASGGKGCNFFERWAGLDDGNYDQC